MCVFFLLFLLYAEKLKVANLIKEGMWDVVRPQWVIDCTSSSRLLSFAPKYMVFTTGGSQKKLAEIVDPDGDSYFENVDEDFLREVVNRINDTVVDTLPPAKRRRVIEEVDRRYFGGNSPLEALRPHTFYLDRYILGVQVPAPKTAGSERPVYTYTPAPHDSRLDLLDPLVRFYGGIVMPRLAPGITHVVVDDVLRNHDKLTAYFEG